MQAELKIDADVAELISDVFASWRTARGPAPLTIPFDEQLWSQLAELGLGRLTAKGGSGASWIEAAGLLRTEASTAAHVPFVETDLLAGWLLEQLGLDDASSALRTVAFTDADGTAWNVPWAQYAEEVIVLSRDGAGWTMSRLHPSELRIVAGTDVAGLPRDRVEVVQPEHADRRKVDAAVVEELQLRGALARAVQMTGALDRIVQLSIEHAEKRSQFGRALAKFQAVQHLVADSAAELALANVAVDVAVAVLVGGAETATLERAVAVARSVVGHASEVVVRNGHQVHGAMGTTFEHQLHEFSKPVLAWNGEFGSLREWDLKVARFALDSSQGLWASMVPTGAETGVEK